MIAVDTRKYDLFNEGGNRRGSSERRIEVDFDAAHQLPCLIYECVWHRPQTLRVGGDVVIEQVQEPISGGVVSRLRRLRADSQL